jgi:hypothetical protein
MGGLRPGGGGGGTSFSGVLGAGVSLTLTGGGSIVTTGAGNLSLIPDTTGYTIIGNAGATSRALNTNDDLFVTGRLEVDGILYADGGVTATGAISTTTSVAGAALNLNSYCTIKGSADDGMLIAPVATDGIANNHLILTTYNNSARDHDHQVASTDPTFFIQSNTDPDTVNTQYSYQRHNQVDAEYGTGLGGIILAPASGALWHANTTYPTSKNFGVKMIHQILSVSTIGATTVTGVTPGGMVLGAALRVNTDIEGLDSADHSISLGTAGDADKYGTVSEGVAEIHISKNKKFVSHGNGLPEPSELIITIGGGADQTPTAGSVEIEIHFVEQSTLADT